MTVNAIEAGTGDLWCAKQTTLGTIQAPTDTGTKHLRHVGEAGLKAAKKYGMEEWVDGQRFSNATHFIHEIGGDVGGIRFQAQPENAAWSAAQAIGSDTVTGASDPYTHTIATSTANGSLQTYRAKTGVSVGPWRQSWYDTRINEWMFEAGQEEAKKTAHIEHALIALKAGEWFTADPTAADSGTDPFNWTEASGGLTIDAVAFNEIDGETVKVNSNLGVHRGDAAAPACFIYNKGFIERSFSALVTDNTIPVLKSALFGTTSPTNGTAISSAVEDLALESTYTRSASRTFKITTPSVIVSPEDFEVFPRAEGGKIPVVFAGRCQKSGATAALTIVGKTADAAAYV